MVTRADLILRIEDMLYGMARVERPSEDVVTLASASATSMTVTSGLEELWQRGTYGEVAPAEGSEGEVVIVAADAASGSATVRRGQRGTTAASATSQPARIDPLYPRKVISDFIDQTIVDDLYPHVWYHSKRSLSWVDQDYTYDLADEDYHVVAVYQYNVDSDNRIQYFPRGWWDVHDVDTEVGSSGKVLTLRRVIDQTATVYYTARSKPIVADLASFPDPLADLIPWAVMGQLVGGTRTAPRRYDPNRQALPDSEEGGTVRDWRFFEQKFMLKRQALTRQLRLTESQMNRQRDYRGRNTRVRRFV